jgi:hypothetical protein
MSSCLYLSIHSFIYSLIYGVFTGLSKRRVRGKIIAIHNRENSLDGNGCAGLSSYRWEGTSRCNSECLVLKVVII